MTEEFGFTVMDGTQMIQEQQDKVRRIVQERIDLTAYLRKP